MKLSFSRMIYLLSFSVVNLVKRQKNTNQTWYLFLTDKQISDP